MSGLTSPSTTNLLSSAGNDTIAPDVEETDLEAGRGSRTAGGKQAGSTASGNQLGAPSGSTAAQGQMNAPQREQSIWEQSAYVTGPNATTLCKQGKPRAEFDPLCGTHRHPVALFFLLFFRSLAIVVYLLCGFFSSSCRSLPRRQHDIQAKTMLLLVDVFSVSLLATIDLLEREAEYDAHYCQLRVQLCN